MAHEPHRARVPLEVYPVKAGIKGGVAGGVVMAVLAVLYGAIAERSIWYPVNLLSAGFFEGRDTRAELVSFRFDSFVVALAIENNTVSPEFRDTSQALKHMAFYYANLAQMDDCLGKVIGAVQDLGLENDTIVCYTSDHGEMLGDLGLWQKFQFYEGSCGVPLMFRVPGQSAGVCSTPVSLVSLSATLTDLAGVPQLRADHGPGRRGRVEVLGASWHGNSLSRRRGC